MTQRAEGSERDTQPAALASGGSGAAAVPFVRRAREILGDAIVAEAAIEAVAALLESEDRARRRAWRMQELTVAIAGAVQAQEVGDNVMRLGVSTTGANAGMIALRTTIGAEVEVLSAIGYSNPGMQPGGRWPLATPGPVGDATLTGAPVFLPSPDEWRARYGMAAPADSPGAAWAIFPLLPGPEREAIGALAWTFREPRDFSRDAQEHLDALSRLCAQALERVRLHEAELRARRASERALDRLGRLQVVTARLSEALTAPRVAEVVVDLGVSVLGASAGSLALLDAEAGLLDVVRAIGYPAIQVERFRRIPLDLDFPLSDAVRLGEAIILANADERHARYPHLAELRRTNGNGGMASVPLVVDGRPIGAIGLNFPEGVELLADDRSYLLALADQCAQALERARLYEAERRARADAEAANRAKSEFLASMSHELRTPLNAIGGFAELLEMGVHGPLNDDQRRDLGRIQFNQRHLLTLINDVLNFAKIEAGHLVVQPRAISVGELFCDLETLLGPQLRAKGIAVEVDAGAPGMLLLADPEKTRQILLNLLSNALKFTPAEGRVTLSASARTETVSLEVCDTGVGIPEDKLEAVFEPFIQLDRTLTSPHQGTGLGLSISRDLARAMNGDLVARSAPGEGATFVLTLPRASV